MAALTPPVMSPANMHAVSSRAAAVLLLPATTCLSRYLQKIRSTVRPVSSFSPSVKRRTVPSTTL